MQIEYGSYRWITSDLNRVTLDIVLNINRVNTAFEVKRFRNPSKAELLQVWRLNQDPLSLATVDPDRFSLMIFGSRTSVERDERGRPKMFSPEVAILGRSVFKMEPEFRQAMEAELMLLAKFHRLLPSETGLSLCFPPAYFAVKAKISPV